MKFSATAVALFVGAAIAMPAPQSSTSNELISGGCKKVTLVYARASTETGNMVSASRVKGFGK